MGENSSTDSGSPSYGSLFDRDPGRTDLFSWLEIGSDMSVLFLGERAAVVDAFLNEKAAAVSYEFSPSRNYDIILINGILPSEEELAAYYTGLSARGKMLLSVNNRFGLRFLNGAVFEEGQGPFAVFGAGAEGKLCSRETLLQLSERVAPGHFRLYYPCPDYLFPVFLFSDDRLPEAGEAGTLHYPDLFGRIRFFDESRALETAVREGVWPTLATSFSVLFEKEGGEEEVVCVRNDTDRASRFCKISNLIRRADRLSVRVEPSSPLSARHVTELEGKSVALAAKLAGTPFQAVPYATLGNGAVTRPYVCGRSMQSLFDEDLRTGRREDFDALMGTYLETVRTCFGKEPFTPDVRTEDVFGRSLLPEESPAGRGTPLDFTFSNIIVSPEGLFQATACEWSFPDLSVPADLLIFRAIRDYYRRSREAQSAFALSDMLFQAGIGEEEAPVCEAMDRAFEAYITKGSERKAGRVPAAIETDAVSTKDFVFTLSFDFGEGYAEENDRDETFTAISGRLSGEIALPEGVKALRLVPSREPCILKRVEFFADGAAGRQDLPLTHNGRDFGDNIFFTGTRPTLVLDLSEAEARSLTFGMDYSPLDSSAAAIVDGLLIWMDDKKATLAETEDRAKAGEKAILDLKDALGAKTEEAEQARAEAEELRKEKAALQEEVEKMRSSIGGKIARWFGK